MYQAIDVCDQSALKALFAQYAHIHSIIHLAAQAGVRRSREEQLYLRVQILRGSLVC
ncbi:NAD-dependent epimerase/dehydratase family protein [Aristophania vespae]|uniref:NAD-dependent epimerase/dehydratase family protein n=1 Tax=Aristophania vespae TaxID=2697033 RepID=A0A6P1NFU0_9PROT|nr:NAD-dependent epimerase/dehydratase family protein [Aristophania vespae]QHI96298.1 NAD-dependent epimerase/dehydratase family protein [Aristophania vespae]